MQQELRQNQSIIHGKQSVIPWGAGVIKVDLNDR